MQIIGNRSFKLILAVWIAIWIIFIIRENKPGQHANLKYLYGHSNYDDKVSYLLGADFHDFLVFCKDTLPAGATYRIYGLEAQDYKKVQARYFLWPLKMVPDSADFMIFYRSVPPQVDGYRTINRYRDESYILAPARKRRNHNSDNLLKVET